MLLDTSGPRHASLFPSHASAGDPPGFKVSDNALTQGFGGRRFLSSTGLTRKKLLLSA
jgi:hypothetical protein